MFQSSKKTSILAAFAATGLTLGAALPAAAAPSAADAARADMKKTLGFVPQFVSAIPDPLLPGLWDETKNFHNNPKTALSNKHKDLIALAVASQSGQASAVYAYGRCARANGASQDEAGEAVAIAALARRYSTFINGIQVDENRFRREINKVVSDIQKAASGKDPPPAPKPIAVVNAKSALADIQQSFGSVPEFMEKMPPEAVAGAWRQLRDLEMNPQTALPGKMKSLISLAVAAQIPCKYCIIADTAFAKLEGASDREIREAVTMAGIARSFGTLIEGLEVDEVAFRRDWDRLTSGGDRAVQVVRKK